MIISDLSLEVFINETGVIRWVVSIAYGGNVVGSLTQKSDSSTTTADIKGKFTLEVFKGMGNVFGAGVSAELSLEEKEKLNSYNLDVSIVADFSMVDDCTRDAHRLQKKREACR